MNNRMVAAGVLLALSSAVQAAGPAETATAAAIARVEALNPKVNAVIALDPTALDQARALDRQRKARGPLFGLPVLIKDNIDTLGPLPTTAGSLALQDNVTNRDAPVVAGLRSQGAVILGKTNLSEWANIRDTTSISGWSAVGGQTRNPFALNRGPCGSSSGSGAAVGAGMVTAAIGTETDGSVTCPAAQNGIVGLKPTLGLVSRTHVVPISHSQDTPGPMTADVRTAALLMNAIAGSDPADPATREADTHRSDYVAALDAGALKGKRIGVLRWSTGGDAQVAAVFEAALEVLKAQGAVLVDVEKPKDHEAMGNAELVVLLTELKVDLADYLATAAPAVKVKTLADVIAFNKGNAREMGLFGQSLFDLAQTSEGLNDPDYIAAKAKAQQLAGPQGIDAMLAAANAVALVAPTAPPAPIIDVVGRNEGGGIGAGNYAAIAGTPHLTVPMGAVKGLPVGLSFLGAKWSDAQLLSLGYAFEQAAGIKLKPGFPASIESIEPSAALLARPR
jgi:amidase